MRRFATVLVVAIVIAGLGMSAGAQRLPGNAQRPNVVLIITDDVGYGDIGSYGAPVTSRAKGPGRLSNIPP